MKEEKINPNMSHIIKLYWRLPLYTIIVLIIITISAFLFDIRAGIVSTFISLVFGFLLYILQITVKTGFLKSMTEYAMQVKEFSAKVSRDIDIPIAFIDEIGVILWANTEMNRVLEKGNGIKPNNLMTIFKELQSLDRTKEFQEIYDEHFNRKYRICVSKGIAQGYEIYEIYLHDETDIIKLEKELVEEKIAVGMIYLDNYDDVYDSVEEATQLLFPLMIDRRIEGYIKEKEGIIKKMEKDKYFFIIRTGALKELEDNQFDILEDIKEVKVGNKFSVTMSIGIGIGGNSYAKNHEYARIAMDTALARGGDQTIIQDREKIRPYGGKAQTVERTTRVKARVNAQNLRELILEKPKILIMGHINMDIDCFGAAIGIWRLGMTLNLNKSIHILMGQVDCSLRPMYERFLTPEYPKNLFVHKEDVEEMIDEDTMLIVVDVNNPRIMEYPQLLDKVKNIVLIDHHRHSGGKINNTIFTYIEPYASSTCEMIAEILQYTMEEVNLKEAEADAMYGGIVIDTQNFINQTGIRTFEAAAFLKRKGADITRVRKIFREGIASHQAKAETVRNARIVNGMYAFGICHAEKAESPIVTGSQTANELLNIKGVKASFVVTKYKDTVYLSARSIDEVNVQMIVEKLKGGGHRNAAGVQFKDITEEEALEKIEMVVRDMIEKGEL